MVATTFSPNRPEGTLTGSFAVVIFLNSRNTSECEFGVLRCGLYLRDFGHVVPAWILVGTSEPAAAGIAGAWDMIFDLIAPFR